jgi:hypothetical protein
MHAVLAEAHLRLNLRSGMGSYAQSCPFRGHHVPHLAVQTDLGVERIAARVKHAIVWIG